MKGCPKKVIYSYCKRCDLIVTHDRIIGGYMCRACGCENPGAKEIIPKLMADILEPGVEG